MEEVEVDESVPTEDAAPEAPVEPEKHSNPTKKRKRRLEEEKTEGLESRYMNKIYSKISKPEPVNVEEPETSALPSDEIDPELLQHETLTPNSDAAERTLFIANVPVKVLTSKPLLRSLKQLFSKHGQISSIRFRSIAFTDLVPRKVAYITKTFHPERDTVNAYIVYNSAEGVQSAVESLNGAIWEGKHLRVDSVSKPSVSPL
jgi:nucleolar protein 12